MSGPGGFSRGDKVRDLSGDKVQYQYARPANKKIVGGVPVYESERWSSYA